MKYLLRIAVVVLATGVAGAQQIAPLPAHQPVVSQPATGRTDQTTAPQVTGKPVARVNGAVLTDRDLLREMYAMFPYARIHNGFPKSLEPEIRKGAMDMIIFEELVYQEAERRKMTIPVTKITRAELQFKAQFPNTKAFQEYMRAECNGSRQVLRQRIRRSLLIEALLKLEVQDKSVVSVSEAKAFYDKNSAQFSHGETFTIQTISILPPESLNPDTLKEQERRAQDVFRQARATKSYQEFGVLAEKVSEDDFRVNMGDHHAVRREDLPPEIVKAALAMQPGQVSDLIRLGDAYTLFRLNAHTPPGKVPFESVRGRLQTDLQKAKTNQLRSDLDQKLQKNAKIEQL